MTADAFHVIRSREAAHRMDEEFEDKRETDSDLIVVSKHGGQRDIDGTIEIKYDQEAVAEWFDGPIPDVVLDLLEIGVATYAADRNVERTISIPTDDYQARVNTRNLCFTVPVLSADLSGSVAERLLGETVSRTSRDLVEYRTYQPPVPSPEPLNDSEKRVDAVSLFSGGIDSTGGVFHNRREAIEASYLSLNYAGVTPLVSRVGNQVGINPEVVGIDLLGRSEEFTSFSRGFLHLAFGVAAALGRGAPLVQCFENGLLARFDVLQDGWMTTRTVQPEFLDSFNTLLREAVGERVAVDNPFDDRTKTEVSNLIPSLDVVLETVSCPHADRFHGVESEQSNCGLCVPCVVRTISLRASDHSVSGSPTSIFSPFPRADFDQLVLELEEWNPAALKVEQRAVSPDVFIRATVEIAYFCRHLLNGDEEMLISDHPELYDARVLDFHRQFAKEFESAIESISTENQTAMRLL